MGALPIRRRGRGEAGLQDVRVGLLRSDQTGLARGIPPDRAVVKETCRTGRLVELDKLCGGLARGRRGGGGTAEPGGEEGSTRYPPGRLCRDELGPLRVGRNGDEAAGKDLTEIANPGRCIYA